MNSWAIVARMCCAVASFAAAFMSASTSAAVSPDEAECAALFYPISSNGTDPQFLKMLQLGISRNHYVHSTDNGRGWSTQYVDSIPQATVKAVSLWKFMFKDYTYSEPNEPDVNRYSKAYSDRIFQCMDNHSMEAPKMFFDVWFTSPAQKAGYYDWWERRNARVSEEHRVQAEQHKVNQEAAARNAQAMQEPSDPTMDQLHQCNALYAETQRQRRADKWEVACEYLRELSVKSAKTTSDQARYFNFRFVWE